MSRMSARELIDSRLAAVEESPDSAMAHYKLGLAYTQVGKMDSSARAYRKAVELDPTLAKAWVNLGGALFLKWDFDGAVEANERALEVDPDLLEAHFGLGQARLYQNRAEDVVSCYERVVELDPEHGAGHYYLAVGRLATDDVVGARDALSRSMYFGHQPRPEFLRELEKAEKKMMQDRLEGSDPTGPSSAS